MQKFTAKAISILLHPLLMPLFFSFLYLRYATILVLNTGLIYWFFAMIFTLTCLIPISSVPILINTGLVKSYKMHQSRERVLPLFITAISYYFTYFMLTKLNVGVFQDFKIFLLSATTVLVISMLISYKWKISAHLTGIGGVTGGIIAVALKYALDFQWLIIVLVLLSGLAGYARLKLDEHTPLQVLSGFMLGALGIMLPLLLI